MFLVILVLIAYLFGVNFYALTLIKSMYKEEFGVPPVCRKKQAKKDKPSQAQTTTNPPELPSEKSSTQPKRNGNARLLLTGLLGGAITVYVCMFLYKYRTKDMSLMILLPVLAAINGYAIYVLIRYVFATRRF